MNIGNVEIWPRPLLLLTSILAQPGNEDGLAKLLKQRNALFDVLENRSLDLDLSQYIEKDSEWVIKVLGVLGSRHKPSKEEQVRIDAVSEIVAQQDAEIGRSFSEALLPALPTDLQLLERWFSMLPTAPDEFQEILYRSPAVRAAGAASEVLVQYGLTPLTIFLAARAVSNLADRDIFELEQDQPQFQATIEVRRTRAVAEIEDYCECSDLAAQQLFHWLFLVADWKPYVFPEFKAQKRSGKLYLSRTSDYAIKELGKYWSVTARNRALPQPTLEP
jgi:hypothetical protein